MIRKTGARRLAALTSGALMAGGLVAAPAMAGLASASAAPVSLDYTCTVTGAGQSKSLPTTLSIDVTVPDSVVPGAAVPTTIATTFDMGSTTFGPVEGLNGEFNVPLTVGGETTVIKLASASAPLSGLVFTSSGSGELAAPSTPGTTPITVGTVTSDLGTTPDFGMPASMSCTPNGTDQTVGTLNVEGDGPVDPEPETPEGILYNCTYASFPNLYPAYVDVDADLPESIDQASGYDPEVNATVTWTEEATAGFNALELSIEPGTAHLHLTSIFAQGEGQSEIIFPESEFPAEGSAVWTGAGNLGVLDTSVPGTHTLSLGDGGLEANVNIPAYTGDAYMPATFDCTVAEGQDTVIGSVTVNESGTSPACTDAQAKADKAQAKVKKTKAQVKKAKAKVKQAKGKKAKAKAKKQLKNAKTKAQKAKKQLKKAKQAVADNCRAG